MQEADRLVGLHDVDVRDLLGVRRVLRLADMPGLPEADQSLEFRMRHPRAPWRRIERDALHDEKGEAGVDRVAGFLAHLAGDCLEQRLAMFARAAGQHDVPVLQRNDEDVAADERHHVDALQPGRVGNPVDDAGASQRRVSPADATRQVRETGGERNVVHDDSDLGGGVRLATTP